MKPLARHFPRLSTPCAAPVSSLVVCSAVATYTAWLALASAAVSSSPASFAANLPVVVAQATAPSAIAQSGTKAAAVPMRVSPTAPAAPAVVAKLETKPLWKDLTPGQQQSLKPLAANWSTISEAQKRKWLALSRNFPSKAPAEQAKLHSRMTEWVSLSQQQRTQARLNFAETKALPPHEKAAQWKAYQALSPEEKQKLAAKGRPAPAGATSTVKPVPEQKLAKVPATRRNPPAGTVAAHSPKVDANTLLPLTRGANASADPSAAPKN